ncbi:MAG: hypothetical protein STHCBS139747_007013 [Sporothrix thermara]
MTTNPDSRQLVRDVYFADLRTPEVDLGGLAATPGITNSIFHTIVGIALDLGLAAQWAIQDSSGGLVPRDESQLLPGRYLILSDQPIVPSAQPFFTRALSGSTGPRLESFKQQVRARDGRCVISKIQCLGPQYDIWRGFEAAHIVPLAYENEWNRRGFANLITIPPPAPRQSDTVNSVQNGLLMQASLHELFSSYDFSILPDAGYKIIFFMPDMYGLAGTSLDRQLLDDPRRPLDALLRWHFEQAVLCNVRGAGEPSLEHDLPPGSDMMGEILQGPKAGERMEFELFTRLGASQMLEESEGEQ